jgi:hypothetical protein
MKKSVVALLSLSFAASSVASQLFVAEQQQDKFVVQAITGTEGYNNQPLVTEQGIYFTSDAASTEPKQTDLYFYDFASKQTRNLTNSPVSEFSPTLYPYGEGLSTVVVEPDGTQRLWFYPFDSSKSPTRLYDDLKPVGYHAWGANQDLILFMLGEPHYLLYSDIAGKQTKEVVKDIGRSIAYNQAAHVFSFTYNEGGQLWFATQNERTKAVSKHFALPKSVQDYTWVTESEVAYAVGGLVYKRKILNNEEPVLANDFSNYCAQISRLSYNKNKLAFVCEQAN